jgi:hypothetical protein
VEIQIDEIGPSLRWATATVNKTQRQGGDWSSDKKSDTASATAPVARDDFGPDEAPF